MLVATFSVALFAVLLAGTAVGLPPSPAAGVATLGVGTLLVLATRSVRTPSPRKARVAAIVLGALAGAALVPPPRPLAPDLDPEAARVEGTIVADDGDRAIVESGPFRIAVPGLDRPPGTAVALDAAVVAGARFRNPSPHPDWPLASIDARVTELRRVRVVATASWPRRLAHAIRGAIRRALEETLPPDVVGIARALVLGDARAVDADVAGRVRGAGLTHVLAVSGMHVTLVVGSLAAILRWLLVRLHVLSRRLDVGRLAAGLAVPLTLAYAELAGGAPSAWRAAITAALGFALRAAGRRPRPGVLVAACVVPFAALEPALATSPAFVLSIVATVAVLQPAPVDAGAHVVAAQTSVRATIATAPVVVWCFGGAPIVGVLANVVVVPLACALLLVVALVHAGLATCGLPGAGASAELLTVTSRAFVAASEAFGRAPVGLDLPPLDLAEGLVLVAIALLLLWLETPRAKALAIIAALLAMGAAEIALRARETPHDELRVTFVDVGQGDAALLDLPDGRLVVIDVGGAPNGGADPGEHAIVPLLRARRRSRIDLLVVSHPHPDHYGGLAAVAARFPITELWDTRQARAETPDGDLVAVLDALAARGTAIRGPESLCDRRRTLGRLHLDVLAPCPAWDPGWDPNDNSFVVRARFGARSFLFAGDAEAHEEAVLAGRVGPVDVLKVGHHGSRTSSSEAWLDELSPWLAIVSAGRLNRFGHPHADVRARLERAATHVVRTDEDGGVVVRTDGTVLRFETWSGRSGELVNH